jgi:hypothetical protein
LKEKSKDTQVTFRKTKMENENDMIADINNIDLEQIQGEENPP